MLVNVLDPHYQTLLFITYLVGIILLSAEKDQNPHEMNTSHTLELKGIAILMVVFSHIGYFLFADHRFLFPMSVGGGIGVNIFLLLSGFGLTSSEMKYKKPVLSFYAKRLKGIFVPMWLALLAILCLDVFILGKSYSSMGLFQNFFGFFPYADIYGAFDSPLWYFSLILFYYLIFPLVYRNSNPIISAVLVLLLGFVVTHLKLPVASDVLKLYQLHYIAFPLGMVFALLNRGKPVVALKEYLVIKFARPRIVSSINWALVILASIIVGYTAIHSGVGDKLIIEQSTSIITVVALVVIMLFKDIQSRFLILLGKYSYEIYLLHWPIMYRYDFIYKYFPAFLGTLLYIFIFIAFGFIFNRITRLLVKS